MNICCLLQVVFVGLEIHEKLVVAYLHQSDMANGIKQTPAMYERGHEKIM